MLKKTGKKKIWLSAATVALILAMTLALLPAKAPAGAYEVIEEIRTAGAEYAALSEQLISGGTISDAERETVALAGDIKIKSWEVGEGDYVEAGQLLASLDRTSVLSAISGLSTLMQELDAELESSRSDSVSSVIYAPVSGTVGAVYAEIGKSVLDTMYESTALIVLNSDVSGEAVRVVGYTGTVSWVSVAPGDQVSAGQALICLTDTEYSGRQGELMRQRQKLEEQMQALFSVYERGGIYAATSRRVSGLNTDALVSPAAASGGTHLLPSLRSARIRYTAALTGSTGFDPAGAAEPSPDPGQDPDPSGPLPDVSPDPEGGETTDPGEEEPTVEYIGRVSGTDPDSDTLTVQLTDGSVLTLSFSELEGKTGSVDAGSIKTGDILALRYRQDSGELISVTVYQSSGGSDSGGAFPGDGDMNGGMGSGMSGGAGSGAAAAGEETDTDYNYSMSETELCTLTDYSSAEIFLTVDELDIGRLKTGQTASVVLDALGGQRFEGTISSIDPNGDNSGGNTKYTVTVSLSRTRDMLTGMNASVYIVLEEHPSLLLVPLAAINEDSGGIYVYTAYDSGRKELTDPVEVTTGLSDGTNVEIISGLSEGDTCYYSYADTLKYNFAQ